MQNEERKKKVWDEKRIKWNRWVPKKRKWVPIIINWWTEVLKSETENEWGNQVETNHEMGRWTTRVHVMKWMKKNYLLVMTF